MHMGGMKFKQRGREEQAEADGTEASRQSYKYHLLPTHTDTQSHHVLLIEVVNDLLSFISLNSRRN